MRLAGIFAYMNGKRSFDQFLFSTVLNRRHYSFTIPTQMTEISNNLGDLAFTLDGPGSLLQAIGTL